jgi:hypothetical protein
MRSDKTIRYWINSQDQITRVNEAWQTFAAENGGVGLVGEQTIGRSLWDFIADPTTRQLYRQLLARVRRGQPAQFLLRCDSPTCVRLVEMTIRADEPASVEFASRILRQEQRELPLPRMAKVERSHALLRCCAWCSRIEASSGEWLDIAAAAIQLRLFELRQIPDLTHGICEACLKVMNSSLVDWQLNLES